MYLEKRFSFNVAGKAFCITPAGLMALVAPLAEIGDALVHVRGGYIPILSRRKAPGARRAELVGTCILLRGKEVYSGSGWEDWLLE